MGREPSGQDRIQLLEFYDRLLKMKPVFERLFSIAESKLLQAAESGYDIPSHKVTKGRCSRDWNVAEDILYATFGDLIMGDAPLLSVAQAEKKIGKSEVKQFIRTNEGSNKLAPRSSILNEVSINASEFN